MNNWGIYFGAYGGILLNRALFALLDAPVHASVLDELFGVTLVLFIDKCVANPFWKKSLSEQRDAFIRKYRAHD